VNGSEVEVDPDPEPEDKVTICHKGNTIEVAESAVQAHLDHGDTLGPCEEIVEEEEVLEIEEPVVEDEVIPEIVFPVED
jgi:hypothetical protein